MLLKRMIIVHQLRKNEIGLVIALAITISHS